MGVSKTPQQLAGKFESLANNLEQQQSKVLAKAAMTAKLAFLAAPGAPKGRMSGVGLHGAKVGVRYKIFDNGTAANIRWFGPVHLVNNPTAEHDITPRKRGRGGKGRKAALAFGDERYAKVHKKATKGKHFFEAGREVGKKGATKVGQAAQLATIRDTFK